MFERAFHSEGLSARPAGLDIVSLNLSLNHPTLAAHGEQFSHLFLPQREQHWGIRSPAKALSANTKGLPPTATAELHPCHCLLYVDRQKEDRRCVRGGRDGQVSRGGACVCVCVCKITCAWENQCRQCVGESVTDTEADRLRQSGIVREDTEPRTNPSTHFRHNGLEN